MNTPIYDYVRRYAASGTARLHMPGHKGVPRLGCEPLDLTEISGTEDLIRQSETNAAALFGSARTVYSTGGSSQCVRAMVYLAVTAARSGGSATAARHGGSATAARHGGSAAARSGGPLTAMQSGGPATAARSGGPVTAQHPYCPGRPVIVAARNAHKSLLYAAALCDAELVWLWPEEPAAARTVSLSSVTETRTVSRPGAVAAWTAVQSSLCDCPVTAGQVSRTLETLSRAGRTAAAVYVTSPDYLGGVQDLAALSDAAHRYGVPLLVDNAHGAYLKFLPASIQRGAAARYAHPLDLGADLCCDSAHKTLPVLTGGAYLHIANSAPASFRENAGAAMDLFGSTSPSWLILASLDLCNGILSGDGPVCGGGDGPASMSGDSPAYLTRDYTVQLAETVQRLDALRARLRWNGWTVQNSDPLRLTLRGDGFAMRERLRRGGVEWEYADREFLVLMATPDNPGADLDRVADALGTCEHPAVYPAPSAAPPVVRGETVLTPREAIFAPHETVPVEAAVGRICAAPTVSCPPAVPVAVSGERIGPEAVEAFRYYGIDMVDVVDMVKP